VVAEFPGGVVLQRGDWRGAAYPRADLGRGLTRHYATNDGGWTTTRYDFVWVLGAACWFCGVIFVLIGLIRLWRKPPETNKPEA
jgi:hypothetical protein